MQKTILVVPLLMLMLVSGVACGSESAPAEIAPTATTRSVSPTPEPTRTQTPEPTLPATPTPTVMPSPTSLPTPAESAPAAAFASVGSSARLEGSHEISGKAVIAGLQTLIIQAFTFDGKGPRPDVRLVLGDDVENPAAILTELEPRRYDRELVFTHVPSSVTSATADSIAIYCPETKETYAIAEFR
ncbi:MAG: DM13 domain-containing protein [Anaerolineae bacterium]|nr:DM13 domain-containing protein [Anaerolineae bacterium]